MIRVYDTCHHCIGYDFARCYNIMLHIDIDMDSDDEDSLHQKLIHTGPKIDSYGVETFDVPDAHRIDFEWDT
ncbi:hypothetical protein HanIR_Chr15g0740591 [Helianthus annuus]|nr:hypothetical protein HanIR_Chr15g0740591 [Helianthus annuus]